MDSMDFLAPQARGPAMIRAGGPVFLPGALSLPWANQPNPGTANHLAQRR